MDENRNPVETEEHEEPQHRGLRRLPPREGVHWAQPEVAWPLALFAGVAGSWAGATTRLPGAGAAAAVLLFTPLFAGLLGRGRRALAAVLVLGWSFGFSAGAVGTLLESGTSEALVALPFSELWIRTRIEPWAAGAAGASRWAGLPVAAAVVLAMVAGARTAFGAGSLLIAALAIGAVSGGVASTAEAIAAAGGDPLFAALTSWPPHTALQLAGALLLVTGLAEPDRFGGRRTARPTTQRLGLLLVLLGLGLEPLLHPLWGASVAAAGGG